MPNYHIELLPNVAKCHGTISSTDTTAMRPPTVAVSDRSIRLDDRIELKSPFAFNLQRMVVTAVDGTTVSLQGSLLNSQNGGNDVQDDDDDDDDSNDDSDDKDEHNRHQKVHDLACAFCHLPLVKLPSLRLLSMPSDAFFAVADECSCNAPHFTAKHPLEDTDLMVLWTRPAFFLLSAL